MIPFLRLTPGADRPAIDAAVARVIDRGWFILGPELEAFESEFAAASGARHAVGVGNGTDALAIALRAAGIAPGDEVITSPLSAAYSALAIMMAGGAAGLCGHRSAASDARPRRSRRRGDVADRCDPPRPPVRAGCRHACDNAGR